MLWLHYEAHNNTVRLCRRALGIRGQECGVRNIPSKLLEVQKMPPLSVAHFVPYKAAL